MSLGSMFSQRLGELVNAHKMTTAKSQNSIAQDMGISVGALSNYLSGTAEPKIGFCIKAAEYFQVSTDYLLGVSSYHNNAHNRAVDSLYDSLSQEMQQRCTELQLRLLDAAKIYQWANGELPAWKEAITELFDMLVSDLLIYITAYQNLLECNTSECNLESDPFFFMDQFAFEVSQVAKNHSKVMYYLSSKGAVLSDAYLKRNRYYRGTTQLQEKTGEPFYKIYIAVTSDMGLDIPGIVAKTGLSDKEARSIIMKQMKDAPLPIALKLTETLRVPLQVWTGEIPYIPTDK